MVDFLGDYKNDYEEVISVAETPLSRVYSAYNKKLKRPCYLKVTNKNDLKKGEYDFLIQKIQREEQLTKICKCPNVVELYKKLETNDYIIFELEYCEDNIFSCIINKYGGMEGNTTFFRKILLDMAKALKKIHENGIMHRDIKPNNIFLNHVYEKDGERVAKLGDFGCSIFIQDNKSDPIGTILYSSPEILQKIEYNEKCDLWSLGVTLHEIYFGIPPYGPNYNLNIIMEYLFADKFLLKKSKIASLDILLNRLLTRNQDQRMSFDEFFNFVFDPNFMMNEQNFLNNHPQYINLYNIISKEDDPVYPILEIKESDDPIVQNEMNKKQIVTLVKGGHFPDIMNIPNGSFNPQEEVFNNIIYYDENTNFKKQVHSDSDYFERITPGAFILCTDIPSLDLISYEVINQKKRDKNMIFNLITTGSACDKIMNHLEQNPEFKNCIKKVCIFCMKVDYWSKLKNQYEMVYGVYNTQSEVKNFIEKFSTKEVKPFPLTKLITYDDYIDKYKDRHQKISEYYGNMSVEQYKKNLEEMKHLIVQKDKEKDLKMNPNVVLQGFMTFEIKKDLDLLNKLIIKEYTKETFYGDLNRWLMNSKMNSYDTIAYFTSRLMFSLNTYGKDNGMYYDKDKTIVRRGIKIPYSCLLPYVRAVNKVILLSAFTSTSERELTAQNFSGRKRSKEQYRTNKIFSVIYIITNKYKKNWIPNGINVQKESEYNEKEILYQPFSFYKVTKVIIDKDNYTADIYLETIGKKEILEEEIKKGKNIVYNDKNEIMEVKN